MNPVTIVIPTYAAPQALADCLRAVLTRTAPVPFRAVIMDNGPQGALRAVQRALGREPRATFHRLAGNLGKAAAINRAVELFPSPWYAILDDDTVIARGWLSKLLSAAGKGRPRTAIVGCRLLLPDRRIYSAEMISWLGGVGYKERDLGQRSYERFCDAVCGACMLVRGEALSTIRFDEGLAQEYEDGDFCLKAREAGWKVFYAGSVCAVHGNLFRRTTRRLERARDEIRRRWALPVFPDSHPIDLLRVAILRGQAACDWTAVARDSRRLTSIDPAPAAAWWRLGMALLNLRRPQAASSAFSRALGYRYLSEELRTSVELALALSSAKKRALSEFAPGSRRSVDAAASSGWDT